MLLLLLCTLECAFIHVCVCVCEVQSSPIGVDRGTRLFHIWPVGEPIPGGEKLNQTQLAESYSGSLTGQMCPQSQSVSVHAFRHDCVCAFLHGFAAHVDYLCIFFK